MSEEKEISLKVFASINDWDLMTWCDEGMPVRHELFMVNCQENSDQQVSREAISRVNQNKMLGAGYEVFPLKSPDKGVRISIKEGWSLMEPSQSKLFLESLIKYLV